MNRKLLIYSLMAIILVTLVSFTSNPKKNLPQGYKGKPFQDEEIINLNLNI